MIHYQITAKAVKNSGFAQLKECLRDTKYDYTMEKLIKVIDKYYTFPAIEKADFF